MIRSGYALLRGMYETFKYRTITGKDIVEYVCEKSGQDLHYFFDQYLGHARLPRLIIAVSKKGDEVTAGYRWEAEVPDFHMPVQVTLGVDSLGFIYPTTSWKSTRLALKDPAEFRAAEDLFYFELTLSRSYIDPRASEGQQRRRQIQVARERYFEDEAVEALFRNARLVVFDLNGLVLNDEPLQIAAVNAVLKPYGILFRRGELDQTIFRTSKRGLFRGDHAGNGGNVRPRLHQNARCRKRSVLPWFARPAFCIECPSRERWSSSST